MSLSDTEIANIVGSDQSTELIPTATEAIDDGLHCQEEGCPYVAHGTMAKAQMGRHMSASHGIRKEPTVKTTTTTATKKDISIQIPTQSSYLEELLEGFSVPNRKGIMLIMKSSPEDIEKLREALKSVRVDKNTSDFVIKEYATSIGKQINIDSTNPINTAPNAFNDIMTRKQKEADMRMYDNYISGNQQNQPNAEMLAMKAQIQSLTDLLTKNQLQDEIKALRAETIQQKKENDGALGGIVESMKEFMIEFKHREELKSQEDKYSRELALLKEELKNNNQITDKSERILNTIGSHAASGLKSFSLAAERVAETDNKLQLLVQSNQALAAGIPPETINSFLGNAAPQMNRIQLPSAERVAGEEFSRLDTYNMLDRVTKSIEIKKPDVVDFGMQEKIIINSE